MTFNTVVLNAMTREDPHIIEKNNRLEDMSSLKDADGNETRNATSIHVLMKLLRHKDDELRRMSKELMRSNLLMERMKDDHAMEVKYLRCRLKNEQSNITSVPQQYVDKGTDTIDISLVAEFSAIEAEVKGLTSVSCVIQRDNIDIVNDDENEISCSVISESAEDDDAVVAAVVEAMQSSSRCYSNEVIKVCDMFRGTTEQHDRLNEVNFTSKSEVDSSSESDCKCDNIVGIKERPAVMYADLECQATKATHVSPVRDNHVLIDKRPLNDNKRHSTSSFVDDALYLDSLNVSKFSRLSCSSSRMSVSTDDGEDPRDHEHDFDGGTTVSTNTADPKTRSNDFRESKGLISLRHHIFMKGYFLKQGGSHKSWKRRWFILQGTHLEYFKSPLDNTPTGCIEICSNTEILKPGRCERTGFGIDVATPDRIFHLINDSFNQREEWFKMLDMAVCYAKDSHCKSPPLIFRGFLKKQGGAHKSWKRRWFVLRESTSTLQYFKTRKERELLGTVQLSDLSADDVVVVSVAKYNRPNLFEIRTTERIYLLEGTSTTEIQEWIEKIRHVVSISGAAGILNHGLVNANDNSSESDDDENVPLIESTKNR